MKILVLGATGPTGQQLVKQSLESGMEVVVLVRSPGKLEQSGHEKLKVIEGSVMDSSDVMEAITGCDVVLSALGGRPGFLTPCDVYSKSCDVIVEVMKETKVTRFIACTSWGTKDDPALPFIWRWVLAPVVLRQTVLDMARMEDKLCQLGRDINWTMVKPPRLTMGPLSGFQPSTEEGQLVRGVAKPAISRADVAHFMLSLIEDHAWDGKMVAINGGQTTGEVIAEGAKGQGKVIAEEAK